MLVILSISHSNIEWVHAFDLVRKNRSEFLSFILDINLNSLLIVKSNFSGYCYNQKFDVQFWNRAKSITYSKVKC